MVWIDTSWVWGSAALAAGGAAALGARAMFSPRSGLMGPVVYRGPGTDPPRVALTFDDGPEGRFTPRILDVLGERSVKAAFFVIGRNAQGHPDLVARMHREGHIVGNHSFSHHRAGTLRGVRYWHAELSRADAVIEAIIGRRPCFFRPPMGFRNIHLARVVRQRRYVTVTWALRALDTVRPRATRIVRRILSQAQAGDIVALHDGREPGRRRNLDATVEALPGLIDGLRGRFGLAPLDEVIGSAAYREPPPGATSGAATARGDGASAARAGQSPATSPATGESG
jgi:peptidoglycan/xylan/chitin deacetylase (PgdA/CDA1 family)